MVSVGMRWMRLYGRPVNKDVAVEIGTYWFGGGGADLR